AYALARQQAEPTPVWVAAAPSDSTLAPDTTIVAVPTPGPPPDTAVSTPTPVVTAPAEQLSLDAADFRFLDPAEPGAHARIAVNVTNHAPVGSGPILLGIDSSWLENYTIIGTAPAVSSDRSDEAGLRTFSFPPIAAGSSAHFEL